MSDVLDGQTVNDPALTAPVDTGDADMGAAWDRLMVQNGADRGTDGKFTSSAPVDAAPDGADTASSGGAEGAGEDAQTPPPAAATPAPAHLPQAIKAVWDKMPAEAQGEVARLTGEWDRKFGELGKQLGAVKPIADRLTEATTKFPEFRGMTPDQLAQGAAELAAVQVRLQKSPLQTIIQIAEHYKVLPHLAKALSGNAAGGEGGNQSIAAMEAKIANLEAQLEKAANPDSIRESVSMTLKTQEAEKTLAKWAAAHEHYAAVEADLPYFIGKIIESKGRDRPYEDTLSDAYDMAVNANPEVRAKVRAAEAKATATQPDPQRAANARKAASINVKSSANGRDRTMTEEEAMGAAWDRAMAH